MTGAQLLGGGWCPGQSVCHHPNQWNAEQGLGGRTTRGQSGGASGENKIRLSTEVTE